MTPELTLSAFVLVLQVLLQDEEPAESGVACLSAAARTLRVVPHVAVWLGSTAVRVLERQSGWYLQNGYRVSMEVLTEVVPQRGDIVARDAAWWELQEMLPKHVLAVLFWGETTSLWWRWARDAVGETEVLARLHVPGGHTHTFLVHLAWVGLPEGSEGEDED
jgi:hypothetical protein